MHNQFASQNAAQATNWAAQRRDAIEKAKRLREDHKYSLSLTGKNVIGGQTGTPIDKHSIPGLRNTGPAPVMNKPSVSEGYSGANTYGYGHRRPMSYIYDKPISEEDLQQAANSLRLLKSKMKNNSERNAMKETGDLLDSFAEKPSSQPSTQDSEYGYPAKRQYQAPSSEPYLSENNNLLNQAQNVGNKNYRKIFKPNLKSDDQQDSLTSHMESRKENLSRQSNVKRNVEDENPFGTSATVIPSRIPKNTLERAPSNKYSRESERASGVKRGKPDQPTNDLEDDFYKPSQKQQYQPLEENVYNSSRGGEEMGLIREETPKNFLRVPSGGGVRNSLMVDPDERALKNSRLDVFHSGENERPEEEKAMVRCPAGCGRQFFEDVIEKHAKACSKVFQSKRKKFDMTQQRMTEEQQVAIVKKPVTATRLGQMKKGNEVAIKGMPKWKRDSEAFRAGMKAARGEELTWQEKVAVAKSEENSMIQCEFCSRKFSEKAAEKHVPFCQSKWKKEALKRPTASSTKGLGLGAGKPIKKY